MSCKSGASCEKPTLASDLSSFLVIPHFLSALQNSCGQRKEKGGGEWEGMEVSKWKVCITFFFLEKPVASQPRMSQAASGMGDGDDVTRLIPKKNHHDCRRPSSHVLYHRLAPPLVEKRGIFICILCYISLIMRPGEVE